MVWNRLNTYYSKKVEKQFIAASEKSGSFHALFGNYDLYEVEDGFVVDAKEDCIINHSLKQVLQGTGVTLNEAKVLEKRITDTQYYLKVFISLEYSRNLIL